MSSVQGLLAPLTKLFEPYGTLTVDAPVLLSFVLVCSLTFALQLLFGDSFTRLFVAGPQLALLSPLFWFQSLAHVFAHGDTGHLLSNLSILLATGPEIEHRFGSQRFCQMIATCAFLGALSNALLFTSRGVIGCSGVVFMVLLQGPLGRAVGREIPLSFLLAAIAMFLKETAGALQDDGISHLCHIVGGICGTVFGLKARPDPGRFMAVWKRLSGRWHKQP